MERFWDHLAPVLYFLLFQSVSARNCPESCTCQWINGLPTADCSNLNLTSFPTNIPSNVLVLDLSGNQIHHVQNSTFLRNSLAHLMKLDLSYCAITTIDSSAFAGMSNLRELNLDGNNLHELPTPIFGDIRNLRVLSLRFNQLKTIPNFGFKHLSQLETLDMQSSHINHVDQEGFHGLEHLRSLQLNGNQLRRLTLPTLIALKSLQQLDLHNNPWNCNCHVRDVNAWMKQKKVGSGFLPNCAEPQEFRNFVWDKIPISKFVCSPEILSLTAFNLLPGQNISIECAVFGDPVPTVVWTYDSQPITFTNSSKYENHTQNVTSHFLHILIIRNASEVDGGKYGCFAQNSAGEITEILPLFQTDPVLTDTEIIILSLCLFIGVFAIICFGCYRWKVKQRRPIVLWKNPKGFLRASDKFRDVSYFKASDAALTPPNPKQEETLLLLASERSSLIAKQTVINVEENQNRSHDTIKLPHADETRPGRDDQISNCNNEEDKDSGIQHEEDSSVRNDSSNGNGICTPQDIFTDSDHESTLVVKSHRTVTFSPNTCVTINDSFRRSPGTQPRQKMNCLPGYDPYLGTEV